MHPLLPLLSLLIACGEPDKDDTGMPEETGTSEDSSEDTGTHEDTGRPMVDEDGDGYPTDQDCDDTNPAVNPGVEEIPYNGVDDDCDPTSLDDDLDMDGFVLDEDCDDGDRDAYPGADEVCDLVDNDCDGDIDEGAATIWYPDRDLDGYGDDSDGLSTDDCSDPPLQQETTIITAELLLNSETEVSTNLASSSMDGHCDSWDEALNEDIFTLTVAIWDELGAEHALVLAFERDGTSDWSWYALVDGAELDGAVEGYPMEVASGVLTFGSDGALTDYAGTSSTCTAPFRWSNGAALQTLELRLGLDASGTPTDGAASMGGTETSVTGLHADGYPRIVLVGGDCDDGDPTVFPGTEGS